MDDETTIDHGREAFQRAPGERRKRRESTEGNESDESTRNTGPLDNRPTERYVPSAVTCQQCGCAGEAFTWFQSVPAGDVDGECPERALYFCGIVCLSLYCGEHFGDYEPPTRPAADQYEG